MNIIIGIFLGSFIATCSATSSAIVFEFSDRANEEDVDICVFLVKVGLVTMLACGLALIGIGLWKYT